MGWFILNTFIVCAYADNEQFYIQKYIEYPEYKHINYTPDDRLCARYADDKTPIPLCGYYNGLMYATIPKENEHKKIEVFWKEDISFGEDYGYSSEFFMFKQFEALSIREVVELSDDGYVYPYSKITRAEACRIVANFMGCNIENDAKPEFIDVSKDNRDYWAINNLYKLGIVKGTGNCFFEPDEIITREELVAIVARIVETLGFVESVEHPSESIDLLPDESMFSKDYFNMLNRVDENEISEWARSAYDVMGASVIYDVVHSNDSKSEAFFNPQKEAEKHELARLLFAVLEINLENYK